jgi:hypothetical protein
MQTSGHIYYATCIPQCKHPGTYVKLPVYLNANIRAHDTTEGAFGAILFILIYTVMISGPVEVTGHFEHTMGTCLNTELTSLAALPVNYHVVHEPLPFSFSLT